MELVVPNHDLVDWTVGANASAMCWSIPSIRSQERTAYRAGFAWVTSKWKERDLCPQWFAHGDRRIPNAEPTGTEIGDERTPDHVSHET